MSENPKPPIQSSLDTPSDNGDTQPQHNEVEGTNWTPEERQEISNGLNELLTRRAMHTGSDMDRYRDLETAISVLPGKLDSLLTEYSEHLAASGVSSFELYILGGFARESAGQPVDPDTGIDNSIRPDTDIDIVVRCIPKDGVKLRPNRIPSPFSPIAQKWRENEISRMTDFSFFVSDTNVDLEPDKPRIQLLVSDLGGE